MVTLECFQRILQELEGRTVPRGASPNLHFSAERRENQTENLWPTPLKIIRDITEIKKSYVALLHISLRTTHHSFFRFSFDPTQHVSKSFLVTE